MLTNHHGINTYYQYVPACVVVLILLFIAGTSTRAFSQPSIGTIYLTLTDGTRVILEPPPKNLIHISRSLLQAWLEINVCAVRTYFGRFPIAEFSLVLKPVEGSSEISYGNAMPGNPSRITMYVGTNANAEEYRTSWTLAHEMSHLAFPTLEREYHWLEEGMATYVEPIARVMAGIITEESVWEEMTRKAPEAFSMSPKDNKGLNGVRDFSRIYWGGAMFYLLADIEIRQKTKNKHSLQTALQAILKQKGTMNEDRDVMEVLRCGDSFVGVRVLVPLYEKFGKTSYTPDLQKLWSDLGIIRRGKIVELRNDAPLAEIRQAIFVPKVSTCTQFFWGK